MIYAVKQAVEKGKKVAEVSCELDIESELLLEYFFKKL